MRRPPVAAIAESPAAARRDEPHERVLTPTLSAVAIGLAFTAYAFVVDFSALGWEDEAWFLDVVHRVAAGETLYKDVWYGSTPLAVYAALGPVAAFGAEIAWVKLLVALSCGASATLAVLIARRLGIRQIALLVLALAAFVSPAAFTPALYQPLATTFLLACFLATLAWLDGGRPWRLAVVAGIAAGLALSTKYTVGLLALGAAAVVFLAAPGALRRRLGAVALATAACVATTALVLAPALVQSPSAIWDSAFAAKGSYVESGSISFFGGLRYAASRVSTPSFNASIRFVALYWTAFFIVTLAALAATAWIAVQRRGERRLEAVAVLLFVAAGLGTAYPRFDYSHLLFAAPVIVVGAGYALTGLGGRLGGRRAHVALGVVLALPVIVLLARPPALVIAGGERLSGLPHFRFALVGRSEERDAERGASAIRREAHGKPLFLVFSRAGLYYLLSGVRNPTRYDYPLVSAVGTSGQEAIIQALADRRLTRLCLDERPGARFSLDRLIGFVHGNLVPGSRLGPCRLYRVRAP
jgi:hypothetical protein